MLKHGRSPNDPAVAKSLKYLEKFVQRDGGIYSNGSPYQNYETSLAIQCFAAANADGRYKNLLANAEKFIKSIQSAGNPADENYGGSGYDPKTKRADLSNTSFLFDALQAMGKGADDEAVKRALVFVSRCQNLETDTILRRLRRRSATAASITPRRPAARAKPSTPQKAACGATAR